jgi:hypothetical protein
METRRWHGKAKSTEEIIGLLREAEVRISQGEALVYRSRPIASGVVRMAV